MALHGFYRFPIWTNSRYSPSNQNYNPRNQNQNQGRNQTLTIVIHHVEIIAYLPQVHCKRPRSVSLNLYISHGLNASTQPSHTYTRLPDHRPNPQTPQWQNKSKSKLARINPRPTSLLSTELDEFSKTIRDQTMIHASQDFNTPSIPKYLWSSLVVICHISAI